MLKSLLASALLALSFFAPVAAGAEALPAASSFFGPDQVKSAALSPKGNFVALTVRLPDGREALAVRETADPKKFTIAIGAKENRIEDVEWINENRLVYTFIPRDLAARGSWQVFAIDRDGANIAHLISGNWRHQVSVGSHIKDNVLPWEYSFVQVMGDGSDDVIVLRKIYSEVDYGLETTRPYRLNTRTRRLSDLLEGKQPAHVRRWIFDLDGVPQLAISSFQGHCPVSYRAPGTADWVEIENMSCLGSTGISPVVFDGKDRLYVRAAYQGHDALFQYDLKTRKRAAQPFLQIDGFDFSGRAEVDRVAKKVLGFHLNGDAHASVWLDPHFKALQDKVNALLPQTGNTLHCGTDCLHSPTVLVESSSDRQPVQYYLYTLASGTLIGLGGGHPDIKPAQMGTRDFYRFAARDGRQIPVYVTVPPGKNTGPWPAVVLVHGGPTARGASWEWEAEAQFLASRGYLVIQPEYRGSTGFGYDHFHAGWKEWGGAMQDDLADAAKWAVQKGWADQKRLAIMGASYGGYATLMGLVKNPELFRCGVEWSGVTDINMMFSRADDDATLDWLNYDMKTLIGDPVTDAARFAANSPLRQAARITQPLLIAHGGRDWRVPIAHATSFRDAVSQHNKQVEWIVYADEGHGWYYEDNAIDFWTRVDAFLEKNLKTAR